jgi:hypothetical protein
MGKIGKTRLSGDVADTALAPMPIAQQRRGLLQTGIQQVAAEAPASPLQQQMHVARRDPELPRHRDCAQLRLTAASLDQMKNGEKSRRLVWPAAEHAAVLPILARAFDFWKSIFSSCRGAIHSRTKTFHSVHNQKLLEQCSKYNRQKKTICVSIFAYRISQ